MNKKTIIITLLIILALIINNNIINHISFNNLYCNKKRQEAK